MRRYGKHIVLFGAIMLSGSYTVAKQKVDTGSKKNPHTLTNVLPTDSRSPDPKAKMTEAVLNKAQRVDNDVTTPAAVEPMEVNARHYHIAKALVNDSARQAKVAYVLNQIDRMGLPHMLAAVPMVESNYNSSAVSNKGAAGDWQFMPALAKEYGMSNADRHNFKLQTKAALQNLKKLHERFHDWPLAFAAYNAGPNRVARALIQHPNTTKVAQLNLPTETQNYVVKIMHINDTIITKA